MLLITHNGQFHYDEILATAILLKLYPGSKIIRTRDPKVIETGDIVYDVGRVYDPATNRYDHHQNTFQDTFSSKFNVRLSSAGLIFKHFHTKLFKYYGFTNDSCIFNDILEKIYTEFFLPADAADNGYDEIYGKIRMRNICDVVKSIYFYSKVTSPEEEDKMFMKALKIVSDDLDNYLTHIFDGYVSDYELYYKKFSEFTGDIFIVDKDVSSTLLYEINEKLNKDIKFIIIQKPDQCRILTIPVEIGKYAIKYPLHSEWRGLADEKLVEVSNIPGSIFVHLSGFTGANLTLEGAIKMCERSLENLKCK